VSVALVVALCLSLPPVDARQSDPALIRVYIEEAVGFPEAQQSGKDLAAALAGRKKLITIVDDEDKADVVIEIDERTTVVPKIVIGLGPRPGQPSNPAAMGPSREVRLRVKATLSHADESREITNKNRANDNPGGWRSAAEDVAKQLEKWLNERRAKTLAARPKDAGSVQRLDPDVLVVHDAVRVVALESDRARADASLREPSDAVPVGRLRPPHDFLIVDAHRNRVTLREDVQREPHIVFRG
jgi:hypothetical protein